MKYLVMMALFLFLGCQQLINGQQQSVNRISAKENIFFTTCSGSVEDWGSCNRKARSTCVKGYLEIKRFESPVGGRRELTFQCN